MSQCSNLKLDFSPRNFQSSKATLEEWRNDQTKISTLQTLSVRYYWNDDEHDDPVYQDLINALLQFFASGNHLLQNFQTLNWNVESEPPPSLLLIFETNYPSWSIHLKCIPRSPGIFSSPAVTSLTVKLGQNNIALDEKALPNVQSTIQNLKNLKRLRLSVGVSGCIQYNYSTDFADNGGTFPPLEELVLEWFSVTQRCGEYWMNAMDWSHLRVLDFREGSLSIPFLSLLLPIADKLPALESIGMSLPFWMKEDLRKQDDDANSSFSLIRQLFSTARPQSLRDVRIWGCSRLFLPDIINHHGASLKGLSLHEGEVPSEDSQRTPLSVEDLTEIGAYFKGLEVLALDVNISKEHAWPEDVIGALASPLFSSLKKLTVFSLLGISGSPERGSARALATTEEDVKSLSSSLSATSLKEIKVRIGEKRTVRGRPAGWVLWEKDCCKTVTMNREADEWLLSSVNRL
ncbi:hypothetical protein BJ322DRAFT_121440 [Thelephora terrestris]|uniref:Uncharacterized protein n=1 Tax=Thelephora terrestris TaxID=56493 RepID=A0A9P6LCF7_9AGAM|nr:hypothetical protein BJ322DRAFT_121440 [Thelephora terrestris]